MDKSGARIMPGRLIIQSRGNVELTHFCHMQVLQSIRDASSVDNALQAELEDIRNAVAETQKEQTSIVSGLAILYRHYPQILFAGIIIPIAQQFTGMNAIMFVSVRPRTLRPLLCLCWNADDLHADVDMF